MTGLFVEERRMSRLQRRLELDRPLGFFEEFQELSESSDFCRRELPESVVRMTNPVCGDEVAVEIEWEGETVRGFGYQQKGCWPVVGCLELWGRLLQGMDLEEILSVTLDDILELVHGVPMSKRHAFSLTLRAIHSAASLENLGRGESHERGISSVE